MAVEQNCKSFLKQMAPVKMRNSVSFIGCIPIQMLVTSRDRQCHHAYVSCDKISRNLPPFLELIEPKCICGPMAVKARYINTRIQYKESFYHCSKPISTVLN